MMKAKEHVANVIVASMPYVDVLRPPLGVSVLMGALRAKGVRAKAVYPCVSLAAHMPYDLYLWFGANVQNRFGDYFFANRIFGHDQVRERSFATLLEKMLETGRYSGVSGLSSAQTFMDAVPELQKTCDEMMDYWIDRVCGSPDVSVVACSASCVQLLASLAFLKEVKRCRPDVVTMIGGCECEGDAALEIAAKFDFVDYVLSGDGEETLPFLVQECLNGNRLQGDELPLGIFDRSKARTGIPETPKIAAKDFGYPDDADYFEAIHGSGVFSGLKDIAAIEFSRGCWKGERAHCTFCGINGDRIAYRCKSADRIVQELEEAYGRGVRFFFTTDTVLDLQRMMPALERFRSRRHDAAFMCDVVATLTEEQLSRLADCGVLYVQVGIESLHPQHVRLLRKSNSPSRSIAFLKFAQENHVHVFWNILSSIPGDKPEEYEEMAALLPLLEHLPPPSFSWIRFDRFSEYWKTPAKYGLSLVPLSNCQFLYPRDGQIDPMKISMYFDNANDDARTSVDNPALQLCESAVRQWTRRYGEAVLRQAPSGVVVDTRTCAIEKSYEPTAEETDVLNVLRTPVPEEALSTAFASLDADSWQMALRELHRRRYVVHWDRHWLSLVTRPIDSTREEQILKRRETALEVRRYEALKLCTANKPCFSSQMKRKEE